MRSPSFTRFQTEVRPGEYFCSARELYHVEQVFGGHVLLEDCRNGELVDVPLQHLLALTRVREPEPLAAGSDTA
jgi:hypothetical protein